MASRLDRFEVSIPGGGNTISGLYANSRQQCKIRIDILKLGSDFRPEPLSEAEIKSLTILPDDTALFPPQAAGWSCDDAPNQYNEAGDSLAAGRLAAGAPAANEAPEVFYRYLRCATGKAASVVFMACITLDDGQKISTHFASSDMVFNTKVTVKTRAPYRLQPSDLRLERTTGFSKEFAKKKVITVDQLNWYLPSNLTVVSLTFKNFRVPAGGTTSVNFSYLANHGDVYAGAIISKEAGNVILGELGGSVVYVPDWADRSASIGLINAGEVAIRTIRYFCQGGGGLQDKTPSGECTLIDSTGCESRFGLVEGLKESGYEPVLTAINPSATAS